MGTYDTYSAEYLRYLELLAKDYPTQAATFTEIINLQAIVNLPRERNTLCQTFTVNTVLSIIS